MKRYTIKEIKDKEIWVKCTGKDAVKLCKVLDPNCLTPERLNYYRWDNDSNSIFSSNGNHELICSIDFSQVIFEDEKEIEGYLTPFDMYGGKIKEGSIYIKEGDSYINNNNIRGCLYPLPPEIVEKYFIPKYKEEEKIFVGEYEVLFRDSIHYPTIICSKGYSKQFWEAAKTVATNQNAIVVIDKCIVVELEKINKILERLK
jgi:hypothetical protein